MMGLPWPLGPLLSLHAPADRDVWHDARVETLLLRVADARRAGRRAWYRFLLRESAGLLVSAVASRRWLRPPSPTHARRRDGLMDAVLLDVHHAVRRLLRAPGFTLAAVGMLALGLGATASIWTVVHRVVLRSLPYVEADRLVALGHGAPGANLPRGLGITEWLYVQYRDRSRHLEGVGIYDRWHATLTGDGDAERVGTSRASPGLGRVLGVAPARGRWFDDAEVEAGARVAVLSDRLWQHRFGGDPDVLGRTVVLNGLAYEVVGVMPPTFAFPTPATDVWTGFDVRPEQARGGFNYEAVGRLTPGATLDALRAELTVLIAASPAAFPNWPHIERLLEDSRLIALPESLHAKVLGGLAGTLWMLLGVVGFVLLIACANVANLFLVRIEGRRREVAVRRALGAGRASLARFHLTESLVLALAAGVAALGIAHAAVRLLVRYGPAGLPRLHEIGVDGAVVAVTVLLALVVGTLLGLMPLVQRSGDASAALREGGRGATAGRARLRVRSALMAAQVALALVLLTGAGLLGRSFAALRAADPGFAPAGLLAFEVGLSYRDHPTRDDAHRFQQQLLGRLEALPGVRSAAAGTCLPLRGSCWGDPVARRDRLPTPGAPAPVAWQWRVTSSYFEALGIRLRSGRAFTRDDETTRAAVAVLSAELARQLFPGEDPLGRLVGAEWGEPDALWYTVVGVAEDLPVFSMSSGRAEPVLFLPFRDTRDTGAEIHAMHFIAKTSGEPTGLAAAVRAAVRDVDANVAVARLTTMEQTLADDRATLAFTMALLALAGAAALLLGGLGIYAVVAYAVGRRVTEIGVRLAFGAQPHDVVRMVFRQAGLVATAGLATGLLGAAGLTRFVTRSLYGVSPLDPPSFVLAVLVLAGVAAAAILLPARRAAALRPVEALREE